MLGIWHSGVRPFDPKHFNEVAAENLDGWPMRFNAMEFEKFSATQSEPLQLFEDWMALLNRGYQITPIGSSDSHDVAWHFVGQGRTYIPANDKAPGQIDVNDGRFHFVSKPFSGTGEGDLPWATSTDAVSAILNLLEVG